MRCEVLLPTSSNYSQLFLTSPNYYQLLTIFPKGDSLCPLMIISPYQLTKISLVNPIMYYAHLIISTNFFSNQTGNLWRGLEFCRQTWRAEIWTWFLFWKRFLNFGHCPLGIFSPLLPRLVSDLTLFDKTFKNSGHKTVKFKILCSTNLNLAPKLRNFGEGFRKAYF